MLIGKQLDLCRLKYFKTQNIYERSQIFHIKTIIQRSLKMLNHSIIGTSENLWKIMAEFHLTKSARPRSGLRWDISVIDHRNCCKSGQMTYILENEWSRGSQNSLKNQIRPSANLRCLKMLGLNQVLEKKDPYIHRFGQIWLNTLPKILMITNWVRWPTSYAPEILRKSAKILEYFNDQDGCSYLMGWWGLIK